MFFHVTGTGMRLLIDTRNERDEVMLHCARIGYNP
jgi:hypothetical protein